MGDDNQSADGPYAPFELLCSDVWVKILEKLSDNPRDMINMGSTRPQIYNLLQVYMINCEDSGEGACRLQEILPLILKWLDRNCILELRLVCKRTKNVVDIVMGENERVNRFGNIGIFPRLLPPSSNESYEWRNIKLPLNLFMRKSLKGFHEIKEFEQLLLTKQVENGGNPLLTKQLEIIAPDSRCEETGGRNVTKEELEELKEEQTVINQRVIQFLTRVPAHAFIRYVKIEMFALRSHETYEIVRKVLEALPNIFHLAFKHKSLFAPPDGDLPVVARLPLPPSKNLESISVGQYWESAYFILGQMEAQYGDQLKIFKLVIERYFDPYENRQGAPPDADLQRIYNFPRLVQMDWIALEDMYMCENYFLNIVAPQLKSLTLTLDPGTYQVENLIRFVLHFPSLSEMSLEYYESFQTNCATPMKELDLHQERHPNLKKLTLELIPRDTNIPMLFYVKLCPALEVIKVHEIHEPRATENQFCDFDFYLVCAKRFDESQIWEQAPTLQMVTYVDTGFEHPKEYVCKRPLDYFDPPPPAPLQTNTGFLSRMLNYFKNQFFKDK